MNNKGAWLLRPRPHGILRINEFIENNIIAIGWPNIGSLKGKSKEDIKEILRNEPYNLTSTSLGNSLSTIDILVNQMSIGNLVLIPNENDIYIGEVKSDYKYDPTKDNDTEGYPHQREIKILKKIERNTLPTDIKNSLRVIKTTANLTKYFDKIKLISEGQEIKDLEEKSNFMEVEYPIRPNVNVKITLPKDLTEQEADRLGNFLKTIYFI
ncbi:MAG: restriction endonuclease [Cetobacterium sp.]|uniref:restriction endonuclease n=1 Tax=Cetobacterium sp. TaxID=2071632 RepID=UPI002FCA3937